MGYVGTYFIEEFEKTKREFEKNMDGPFLTRIPKNTWMTSERCGKTC